MDGTKKCVERLEVDRELRGEDLAVNASEGGFGHKVAVDRDDDGRFPKRDGTWRTATAHIITAVIGSGVLSLGWAVAQLGWAFGPLILFLFSAVTWFSASLLCEAYRTGDKVSGRGNQIFCCIIQYINLFATGVGYTVTGSLSVVAAKRAVCFHAHGESVSAPCSFANIPWMLLFGALQLVFSQIPDFGGLWWLSYLATAMSLAYSFIGLGLSIGKAASAGHADHGSVWGVAGDPATPPADAAWSVFVALGSMAFAYSFSMILIEIEDTLKQPPAEVISMKKATHGGIFVTTAFYMSVGCASYAAFGSKAPGNLVTGFGFFTPFWLVSTANVFVFVHLIGAYQVYMQPFMTFVEEAIMFFWPRVEALRWEFGVRLPGHGIFPFSPLKLVSRSALVCMTTLVAIILPFFNDLVGFVGALGFWPLTVYFPVEMHLAARRVPRWSVRWTLLRALSAATLLVSLAAATGAVAFLVRDLKSFKIFDSVSGGVAAAA